MITGVEIIESLVIIRCACFQFRKGNPEFFVAVDIGSYDDCLAAERQILTIG